MLPITKEHIHMIKGQFDVLDPRPRVSNNIHDGNQVTQLTYYNSFMYQGLEIWPISNFSCQTMSGYLHQGWSEEGVELTLVKDSRWISPTGEDEWPVGFREVIACTECDLYIIVEEQE